MNWKKKFFLKKTQEKEEEYLPLLWEEEEGDGNKTVRWCDDNLVSIKYFNADMKEEAEKRSCIKEIRKKKSEDKRRRSLNQKMQQGIKWGLWCL